MNRGKIQIGILHGLEPKSALLIKWDEDVYWSDVWMKKPWCAVYWGGRPTEDWMFTTTYASGAPWNDTHWKNNRFDELLIKARSELDSAKRKEMYYEMQQLIRDDGGVIVVAFAQDLHADNYALGFSEIDAPLEKALKYAQKGVALEPQNQFARDALTPIFFHQGNKAAFLQQVEETIALNPNSPYVVGVAGWHMALFGEWDQGLALLEKGMKLNPYYPSWFHLAPFMNHYCLGKYEDAYAEALKFNFPGLFWDPVMRATSLSQLGKIDEAESAIRQLLEIEQNFETQGRFLIRRYVKVEDIVDKVVEGLRKAGLENME